MDKLCFSLGGTGYEGERNKRFAPLHAVMFIMPVLCLCLQPCTRILYHTSTFGLAHTSLCYTSTTPALHAHPYITPLQLQPCTPILIFHLYNSSLARPSLYYTSTTPALHAHPYITPLQLQPCTPILISHTSLCHMISALREARYASLHACAGRWEQAVRPGICAKMVSTGVKTMMCSAPADTTPSHYPNHPNHPNHQQTPCPPITPTTLTTLTTSRHHALPLPQPQPP